VTVAIASISSTTQGGAHLHGAVFDNDYVDVTVRVSVQKCSAAETPT
jgi:hypothetical protein